MKKFKWMSVISNLLQKHNLPKSVRANKKIRMKEGAKLELNTFWVECQTFVWANQMILTYWFKHTDNGS